MKNIEYMMMSTPSITIISLLKQSVPLACFFYVETEEVRGRFFFIFLVLGKRRSADRADRKVSKNG